MCDVPGCVNYEGDLEVDEDESPFICVSCVKEKTDHMSVDQLLDIYDTNTERFVADKYFRKFVRENSDGEMTGDFDHDFDIFKANMFDTINTILLLRIEEDNEDEE